MRRGEPIAGLGGILLLVALFLPWASTESGWAVLTLVDVLLALLALLAILVPVSSLAASGPAQPIRVAVLASAFGWLGPVLVAYELIRGDLRYGAWVALAGALIAWVGSWLSLRDDSTPGAVLPDVPRRPAP